MPYGAARAEGAPGLARAVEALARAHGATPFSVCLAAFAAVAGLEANALRVSVATINSIRQRVPGLQGLLGFLNNNVVLLADLGGDPTFAELLQRVHAEG